MLNIIIIFINYVFFLVKKVIIMFTVKITINFIIKNLIIDIINNY
jgi:hypothetical protein